MHRYIFLVLLLCYNALCISEKCVTYNFEENQKVNFTNTYGICHGMSSWDVGTYSSLPIDSPHVDSSIFITPHTTLSCISSFKFMITASGTFELNIYMEPAVGSDQITLLVFQSLPGANDATVGNAVLSPNMPNFVPGWQTMRVNIVGLGTHEGYITLLGMASESSTVLVDSFRYIAPTIDKDSCIIYPSDKPTTEKTTTPVTTDKLTTTSKPTTITIPTIPAETHTTEIPTTNPEVTSTEEPSPITEATINATPTTEIPTTNPEVSSTKESSPITKTTIPATSTTEIPTTNPEVTSTKESSPITKTTIPPSTPVLPEKPTTTIIPTTTVTSTTNIPETSTTERATTQNETTTRVTTSSSTTVTTTTSTERPRLSVSILLIKIKKFFR